MIPYLFISGFLGAGKTTLLNNLLSRYHHLKIGVIVNDFGDLAVDDMLVEKESATGGVKELRAGQIFCACLSGSFINTVLSFKDTPVDVLLVECSGLAKPSTLSDIVEVVEKRAPESFNCIGMISVIDATRHAILEQTLMVINEQIESSDILLLSKADQTDAKEYRELEESLHRRYPDKYIMELKRDSIDTDLIGVLGQRSKAFLHVDKEKHAGWGQYGRPVSFILEPQDKSVEELHETLNRFQTRWYRIKGAIRAANQTFCYIDGTEMQLTIRPIEAPSENGIVIITHDYGLERDMRKALGCSDLHASEISPMHPLPLHL